MISRRDLFKRVAGAVALTVVAPTTGLALPRLPTRDGVPPLPGLRVAFTVWFEDGRSLTLPGRVAVFTNHAYGSSAPQEFTGDVTVTRILSHCWLDDVLMCVKDDPQSQFILKGNTLTVQWRLEFL
jgi:hypothetical protein